MAFNMVREQDQFPRPGMGMETGPGAGTAQARI